MPESHIVFGRSEREISVPRLELIGANSAQDLLPPALPLSICIHSSAAACISSLSATASFARRTYQRNVAHMQTLSHQLDWNNTPGA